MADFLAKLQNAFRFTATETQRILQLGVNVEALQLAGSPLQHALTQFHLHVTLQPITSNNKNRLQQASTTHNNNINNSDQKNKNNHQSQQHQEQQL